MIEARCAWTLEGPNDSITFDPHDPSTPWMLVGKPKTVVDDRRETYDYPLDDGGYVGDAYAGTRAWSLSSKLRASSNSQRNTELQRLNAILNSIRRVDGLLKWQPDGFPAVQSIVRRMGGVDYSGGFGSVLPTTFGLISGDPRVYSQALHSATFANTVLGADALTGQPIPGAGGSNLLSANQSSLETNTAGWVADAPSTIARSTTFAAVGTASLLITKDPSEDGCGAATTTVAVTPGTPYVATAQVRKSGTFTLQGALHIRWYTSSGVFISSSDGSVSASGQTSFVPLTVNGTAPGTAAFATVAMTALGTGLYVDDVQIHVAASAGASLGVLGDATTRPVYSITGTGINPVIFNQARGEWVRLTGAVMGGTQPIVIDTANREIYRGSALTTTSNLYGKKSASNPFPILQPGTNPLYFGLDSPGGSPLAQVQWRDAWMP